MIKVTIQNIDDDERASVEVIGVVPGTIDPLPESQPCILAGGESYDVWVHPDQDILVRFLPSVDEEDTVVRHAAGSVKE